MARLNRDPNAVPASGAVSSTDGTVVLPLQVDPITGRLLVSGVGVFTEYTEGDIDTTFTGVIMLGEKAANTASPLQLDANGNLNVAFGTASTLYNGSKAVATAGTAVALSTATTIKSVVVKALYANTGTIYLGSSSVSSLNGVELQSGDSVGIDIDDLAKVYIDASVSGEGVSYIASN